MEVEGGTSAPTPVIESSAPIVAQAPEVPLSIPANDAELQLEQKVDAERQEAAKRESGNNTEDTTADNKDGQVKTDGGDEKTTETPEDSTPAEASEVTGSEDDKRIGEIQDEMRNGNDKNVGELNKLLKGKERDAQLEQARQDLMNGKPISEEDQQALEEKAKKEGTTLEDEQNKTAEDNPEIAKLKQENEQIKQQLQELTDAHNNLVDSLKNLGPTLIALNTEQDPEKKKSLLQLLLELFKALATTSINTTEENLEEQTKISAANAQKPQ